MEFNWIIFLAVFAGVLTRTFVPYLVKLKKNPDLKWENKYIIPAIAGLVLAFIATLLMLPYIPPTAGWLTAFASAYTLQDLSRESIKLLGFE